MADLWEYEPNFSIQKNLQVFNTRKNPTTGAYGPEFIYDEVPPAETVSLKARGLTWTEVAALRTKILTPGGSDTYVTRAGVSITGIPVGMEAEAIAGDDTDTYFAVTLTVRRTDLV